MNAAADHNQEFPFKLLPLHDLLKKDGETDLIVSLGAMENREERAEALKGMALKAARRVRSYKPESDRKVSKLCTYAIMAIVDAIRSDGSHHYDAEAKANSVFCLDLASRCVSSYLPLATKTMVEHAAKAWGSVLSEEASREIMIGLVRLVLARYHDGLVAECLRQVHVDACRVNRQRALIEETAKEFGGAGELLAIYGQSVRKIQIAADQAALMSLPKEARERVMDLAPALGYVSNNCLGELKSKVDPTRPLNEIIREVRDKAFEIAKSNFLGHYFVSAEIEWCEGEPLVHIQLRRRTGQYEVRIDRATKWAEQTREQAVPSTMRVRITSFAGYKCEPMIL